jgi:hypothetical protein
MRTFSIYWKRDAMEMRAGWFIPPRTLSAVEIAEVEQWLAKQSRKASRK